MLAELIADRIYKESTDTLKKNFLKPELFFAKESRGGEREEKILNPLVLLITNKCDGACLYCYVDLAKKERIMDFKLAKKIIDFALRENSRLDIYLFGGGEPTLAFPLMKRVREHILRKKKKKISLHLTTNGFFSSFIAKWIAENIEKISISCDGPPEVQNKNRPLKSNKKSSDILEENVLFLIKKGASLGFRSTITYDSAKKQDEILEYAFRLSVCSLLFSPFRETKRSRKNDIMAVDYLKFAMEFLKAKELAEWFGLKLISDFFPIEPRRSMCGFENPNICVSPFGYVATCWASSIGYTDKPDEFVYGKMQEDGKIRKKSDTWSRIVKRTPDNINDCRNCFLKHSCAGGCTAAHFQVTGDIMKIDKKQCDAIRWLVKQYLLYLARQKHKKIKPFFQQINDKMHFVSYFNRFKVGRKNIMEFNPFIEIKNKNMKKLSSLTESIIKHRDKRGYAPTLFFLNFIFSSNNLNIKTGQKIMSFLKILSDNKIHFFLVSPLPKCIFSKEDYYFLVKKYKASKSLASSLSLFHVKNGCCYFGDIDSGIKFSRFLRRGTLLKKALEIKPFRLYSRCFSCHFLSQRDCGGLFNRINVE